MERSRKRRRLQNEDDEGAKRSAGGGPNPPATTTTALALEDWRRATFMSLPLRIPQGRALRLRTWNRGDRRSILLELAPVATFVPFLMRLTALPPAVLAGILLQICTLVEARRRGRLSQHRTFTTDSMVRYCSRHDAATWRLSSRRRRHLRGRHAGSDDSRHAVAVDGIAVDSDLVAARYFLDRPATATCLSYW